MKNLEKMINDIDVESLEKTINILVDLKVFIKIEKKESEKLNEKQIFELIKDNIQLYFVIPLNFNAFREYIYKMRDKNNYSDYSRQCLFLAIMKGVHHLIEGDNQVLTKWIIRLNHIGNPFYEIIEIIYNITNFPKYWYYSTKKNCEKAYDILSNFFGINILDWWYK